MPLHSSTSSRFPTRTAFLDSMVISGKLGTMVTCRISYFTFGNNSHVPGLPIGNLESEHAEVLSTQTKKSALLEHGLHCNFVRRCPKNLCILFSVSLSKSQILSDCGGSTKKLDARFPCLLPAEIQHCSGESYSKLMRLLQVTRTMLGPNVR